MVDEERSGVAANTVWEALDYALKHVIRILTAVSCCVMFVIVTVSLIPQMVNSHGATLPYTPLPETNEQMAFARATNAAANAFMLLGVIITMTVFMVTLYYYRFYSVVDTWITMSCTLILVMAPITFIGIISCTYSIPVDVFSVAFFVYNFMPLGVVVILYKGKLVVQQFYLIVESSFMAHILIKLLPAWTLWAVLCLIPIWDLVVVLAVIGPLRILVETAKEGKEDLQPGLLFSTMVAGTFGGMSSRRPGRSEQPPDRTRIQRRPSYRRSSDVAETPASPEPRRSSAPKPVERHSSYDGPVLHALQEPEAMAKPEFPVEQTVTSPQTARPPPDQGTPAKPKKPFPQREEDVEPESNSHPVTQESQGIKIGLGDFVFYSVLVGKVATFGDWAIVFATFVGILVGVCVTLSLCAVMQSARPGLPLSLAFGFTFVGFQTVIQNFMNQLFNMRGFI